MKTYKGLKNIPTKLSKDIADFELNRRVKIINLKPEAFFKRYDFVAKRTLRGYIKEAIEIIFIMLILVFITQVAIFFFYAEQYLLSLFSTVIYFYGLFSDALYSDKEDYLYSKAEYYIDIERVNNEQ